MSVALFYFTGGFMAQYDGSIRIGTEITTKQAERELKSLENSISKTADKITSLRSKMDALKNVKTPTQEYKEIQAQIESTEKKISDLEGKQEKFLATGGKQSSSTYQKMQYDLEELRNSLPYLKGELQELVESGKAFTLGSDTEKYVQMATQVQQLNQQMQSDAERQAELQSALTAEEQRLAQIRENAVVGNQHIIEVIERRKQLLQEIKDLEKAGVTQGYEDYDSRQQELAALNQEIRDYSRRTEQARESFKKLGNMAKKVASSIAAAFSSVARKSILAMTSAVKRATSAMFGFGKSTKKSNNMLQSGFKTILKYGLGIRSFYILVNKFRNAVKEGFKNLAQYSSPVNDSLSMLKSSLTQLKNSLATAFAPILTAAAPALTALINMVSRAATYVGMLIAALTGQKTFVKATEVQEDYAASLKDTSQNAKEAKKYLSGLDEVRQYDTGKDSDSDKYTPPTPSEMFETVQIESSISDFAEKIKEAWRKADFSDIGDLIGTKLKDALNNIPWAKVQSTAEKVGKSFATLINGFVEVEKFGYSIGNTIAQAINTGLTGLNSYAKNLHWDSVGTFIADGINGALENIKWSTALSAAHYFGAGLATALNNALTTRVFKNVGQTIGNGINTVLTYANDFLETFKWKKFGTNIGKGIMSAVKKIDFSLAGKTVANLLNAAILTALNAGKAIKFKKIGEKIAEFLNKSVKTLKAKELGKAISTWIKGALELVATFFKETDFAEIGRKIGEFLVGLDFSSILSSFAGTIFEAIKAGFKILAEMIKTAPLETLLLAGFSFLAFTKIGRTIAMNICSSIATAISAAIQSSGIMSALNGGLAGAVAGAVAVFAEFNVVSGAFENLTAGTGNFITEIGKIAGAVTLAGGALTAVFGFPVGLIATAIAGVTGAIAGTTSALNDMEQQMKEEEEISKYGQTLAEMEAGIDKNSEAIRNRIKESENYIETVGVGEAKMAQDLSDRYFDLAEKENKTGGEMQEMKRIAGLLIKQMPELSQYYDEQSGLLTTTKGNIDSLIQSRLQEIRLNAIEEQLTQAYKDQATALQDVEKYAGPVNDAQKEMNRLQEELQELGNKQALLDEYDRLSQEIQYCTGDTDKLTKKQQEVWNKLTDGNTKEFPSFDSLQQEINDTQDELKDFGEKYEERIKKFTAYDETYKAVSGNVSRLTKMYTEGMEDAAGKGIDGYNQTTKNDTSMEAAALQAARDVVDAFNKGQDAHSPSRKFEKAGEYSIAGFLKGIKNNKQSAINSVTDLANEIVEKFQSMCSRMVFVGQNIVNGIIDGIKSMWNVLTSWAQKIIDLFSISVTPSGGGEVVVESGGTFNSARYAARYSSGMPPFPVAPIPALARGTVVPPNREFMAVLGDNKREPEIVSPLSTMKQAVKEAMGEMNSNNFNENVTYSFNAYINRRVLFEELITEAKLRQTVSGRNPFELA